MALSLLLMFAIIFASLVCLVMESAPLGGWIYHVIGCLTGALRHPRIALLGLREFRCDVTTSYYLADHLDAYDSGRELAHMLTFRRYDQTHA